MKIITLTGYATGATDVYAYYLSQSLADYVADKVLFVEGTGSDLGRYTASVDETKGTAIVAFVGATQPTSWGDAVVGVGWDLLLAEFKADAQLGTSPGGMVANAVDIKAKTDLIGTGSAVVSAPVSGDGDLLELILETDYLAANGRALEWSFDEITGITTAATGKFGLKDALTGTEVYVNSTGTVTDLGGGTFKVSFNITNTALNALSPGKYDWSVEVLESPYKITIARNRQIKTRVDIVEKQT